jgi:hypothetical protein
VEFLKFARVQWDRTTAVVAAVLGAVCLIAGFIGVSNTPYVGAQLPYFISGGLFGIFFLGVAATAWLTADLRDEWRELRAIRGLLEEDLRLRRPDDVDSDDLGALATARVRAPSNGSAGGEKPVLPKAQVVRRRAQPEQTATS